MTRDITISPMPFWASLAPWLRDRAMEEKICSRLKYRLALGAAFRAK